MKFVSILLLVLISLTIFSSYSSKEVAGVESDNSVQFTLYLNNFGFNATSGGPEIIIDVGSTVTLNLIGNGTGPARHDWVLDSDSPSPYNVKSQKLSKGQTETISFEAIHVGTFEYYCSISGLYGESHRNKGMYGVIKIVDPSIVAETTTVNNEDITTATITTTSETITTATITTTSETTVYERSTIWETSITDKTTSEITSSETTKNLMTTTTVVSTSDVVEEQLVEEEKTEIQTTQQITQKITQTTEKQEEGGGCLIATAAFGSEITPQVQFLRGFRDNYVMSTIAGSSFMEVFNTWYYSFSPTVADFERQNSIFRDSVKYLIYPLIGILSISEFVHTAMYNSEIGLILAGFIASVLIGIVYLWPIALISKKIRQGRLSVKKPIFITIMLSIILLSLGLWTSNSFILQISTSLFVISTIIISAMLFSNLIISKLRNIIL